MKRLLAFAVILATACVQTNVTALDPTTKLAPTCVAGVQLFTSPEKVPAAYSEVALLNSSGSSSATNEQEMFESMREKAAQAGANGVILGAVDEPGAGTKVAAAIFGTPAERKGKAVAIRIPSDSSREQAACSRTLVDEAGSAWTVSEFQEGSWPTLRLQSTDGRVLYHDRSPENWRELSPKDFQKVVKGARPRK